MVPWIMSVPILELHTQEYDYYLPKLCITPVGTAALTICNEHYLPFYVMTTPLVPHLLLSGLLGDRSPSLVQCFASWLSVCEC